jgi:hypothetical protein
MSSSPNNGAASASQKFYQTTRRYNPEDSCLHKEPYENIRVILKVILFMATTYVSETFYNPLDIYWNTLKMY